MGNNLILALMSLAKEKNDFDFYMDLVMKSEWTIGFRDRGMGRGDYCVMSTIENQDIVVVECPLGEIAQHICDLHNK